jgi:hypothetical protein
MWLELEWGLELLFNKIEVNYHLFASCVFYGALLLLTLKEHL